MAHRIKHITSTGANQTYRMYNAPDCDSAAMRVVDLIGGTVTSVVAIDDDAPRVWGEYDTSPFALESDSF
jgi:hypothetical protein